MLLLPKFDYYEPEDLTGACALLSQLGAGARIIAGGTDILVNMKEGKISPNFLVGVAKIPGLSDIASSDGAFFIGSQVLAAELVESEVIQKKFPILARAASVLGSPLVRNRATIGGNIVTARPAADLIPPLLALGACLELRGKKGKREIRLDDFFLGPGETIIKSEEILTRIIIPDLSPFTGADYAKLGHRKALEIAIVAVASRITLEQSGGVITDARIILSAVAPKAIHAPSAEKALLGKKPSAKLLEEAASLAMNDCRPISDIRGGAEYRKEMVRVLTKRTLENALAQAKGGNPRRKAD